METLKAEVRRGDYKHTLIKRNKHVAMYDVVITPDGEIIGYEVFIIRHRKAGTRLIAGREITVTEGEKFPSNEEFGVDAFAPSTRERADEHYKILTVKMEAKALGISLN